MLRRLIFLCLLHLSLPFPANWAQTTPAANRIADFFEPALKDQQGSIYIAPFNGPGSTYTELGEWTSNYLREQLATNPSRKFAEEQRVKKVMQQMLVAPETVAAHAGVAAWIGKEAGASVIFVGNLRFTESELLIETVALETAKFKVISSATLRLRKTEEFARLAENRIASPMAGEAGAGTGQIGYAECVYCPRPEYDMRAYNREITGVVMLRVLVGTDGNPLAIQIWKSLDPGLDRQAVLAVRKWRFRPSKKEGKPVAAWNSVEIVFRLS